MLIKLTDIIKTFIKYLVFKKLSQTNKYDVIHFNICLSSNALFAAIIKLFSKNTKVLIHSHCAYDKKTIRQLIFRPIVNIVAGLLVAFIAFGYQQRTNPDES